MQIATYITLLVYLHQELSIARVYVDGAPLVPNCAYTTCSLIPCHPAGVQMTTINLLDSRPTFIMPYS